MRRLHAIVTEPARDDSKVQDSAPPVPEGAARPKAAPRHQSVRALQEQERRARIADHAILLAAVAAAAADGGDNQGALAEWATNNERLQGEAQEAAAENRKLKANVAAMERRKDSWRIRALSAEAARQDALASLDEQTKKEGRMLQSFNALLEEVRCKAAASAANIGRFVLYPELYPEDSFLSGQIKEVEQALRAAKNISTTLTMRSSSDHARGRALFPDISVLERYLSDLKQAQDREVDVEDGEEDGEAEEEDGEDEEGYGDEGEGEEDDQDDEEEDDEEEDDEEGRGDEGGRSPDSKRSRSNNAPGWTRAATRTLAAHDEQQGSSSNGSAGSRSAQAGMKMQQPTLTAASFFAANNTNIQRAMQPDGSAPQVHGQSGVSMSAQQFFGLH